jgi:hypothetical protein
LCFVLDHPKDISYDFFVTIISISARRHGRKFNGMVGSSAAATAIITTTETTATTACVAKTGTTMTIVVEKISIYFY